MAKPANTLNKLQIREANQADIPVLVSFLSKLALHVAGSPPLPLKQAEHTRLEQLLETALDDEDKLVVVADLAGSGVVGMGYIYIYHSQEIWEQAHQQACKTGVIDDVWVEPEYRQQGLLSALINELVAFAESRDVQELMLEYAVSNEEAAAVWTRLGFKTTGVRALAFTATVKEQLAKRLG